jgi:hypothetical protein
MKLVTFTTIIRVNKPFEIACSPGYFQDAHHDHVGMIVWMPGMLKSTIVGEAASSQVHKQGCYKEIRRVGNAKC